MESTGYTRKIDSGGRIVIPANLREKLKIKPGDIYDLLLFEEDGRTYLCIECVNLVDEIERAKRLLREAGIKFEE